MRKTETSSTLREVWRLKEAAYEETKDLKTAEEYFTYIRSRIGNPSLPKAPRRSRPARTPRSAKSSAG
jgi:hypothetical protein